MVIKIVYPNETLFKSFHDALDSVAREQIYIEMIEAKPLEEVSAFQRKLMTNNWPVYYAVDNGRVVGWADITPGSNPRMSHRGFLGMGLIKEFRGKGLGTELLTKTLAHAKSIGLEKIELNVRSSNARAIRLYQKLGFNIEGRIRYRLKMPDGSYQDDLEMSLFLGPSPSSISVSCLPIGIVISSRAEVDDDDWDNVESQIKIDSAQFGADALAGVSSFSHIEVIFLMNQVDFRKVEISSRHPRNNQSWPKVGIFAQRGKSRPNLLGLTICRVLKVEDLTIWVKGLDAVNGSPVLDIKPWVKEFGPRGNVYQPEWMSELMKDYW